jgi:hypothetical protein
MLQILAWSAGKKYESYLPVAGTDFSLPVTVIHGNAPGSTVLVTGGIHGSEYVGIAANIVLAREILSQNVTGTIIFVHPVNAAGFLAKTHLVPQDGKNLNRIYPGKPDGSVSDKLAWYITNNFYPYIDYYIDMHGGAASEELFPHVYYSGATSDTVREKARQMALASGQKFLVKLASTNFVTTCSYAGSKNIPSILIECGGQGIWNMQQVESFKRSVSSVLSHLGILKGHVIDDVPHQWEIVDTLGPASEHDGCWYPEKKPGETFGVGELLGTIRDFFGNELQRIVSCHDGVLLYQTCSFSISKGEETVVYGRYI